MVDIADIVARGQQFRLIRDDRTLESFTGTEQYIANRPAYWSFTIPILPRSGVEAKRWRAAIVELSRPSNTFEASPPGYRGSQYAQNGGTTPVVNGAGQLGKSLSIANADANQTVFNVGEYFQIGDELKVVVEKCDADASGEAVVAFEPPLRSNPNDFAQLEIMEPKATFRLLSPAAWSLRPNRLHSFDIEAIESY